MEVCNVCGNHVNAYTFIDSNLTCLECAEALRRKKIEDSVEKASKPSDYSSFSADDLSDAFWISLGRYVKRPNKKDLRKMYDMFLWACHDSHAQSSNFNNALKWCKIDFYEEMKKTLPEE